MQHLRLQALNREASMGYLTLSVTIQDGTTPAAEVMGNINKAFKTAQPRHPVSAYDLSFGHLEDIIQKGAELGVYVEPNGYSTWPKLSSEQARENRRGMSSEQARANGKGLSSEQARANRSGLSNEQASVNAKGKLSWEQASARSKVGLEERVNKKAKHGNRVICQDCGAKVALAPGRKLSSYRHGRGKTGELHRSCVLNLAALTRMEVVKL